MKNCKENAKFNNTIDVPFSVNTEKLYLKKNKAMDQLLVGLYNRPSSEVEMPKAKKLKFIIRVIFCSPKNKKINNPLLDDEKIL